MQNILYMGRKIIIDPDGVTSHNQAIDAIKDTPNSDSINVTAYWYDELRRQNAIDVPKDPNVAALDKLHKRVTQVPKQRVIVTGNPQPKSSYFYELFIGD